jgi:deoxyribodipyrimidine photo-lyase
MSTALVLFRRDLRLHDNPALTAACASHDQVLPIYVHAPDEEGAWTAGAASRWWLHHSLASLQKRLHAHHSGLNIAQGDSLTVLQALIEQTGAEAVYWNRLYEPATIERDTHLKTSLRELGVAVHSHNAALWLEPWQIATQQGDPYRVFTPYWRNLRTQISPAEPLPEPAMRGWKAPGKSLDLAALALLPDISWDAGFAEHWQPGERGAAHMLELFCDDAVVDYAHARDLPARHGTSRLSPHLHFGEISPRQIHFALTEHVRRTDAKKRPDIEPYLRELGWREFAYHLLYHFPQTPVENFNPRFKNFRWKAPDKALLKRWQQGQTGIPLVDAGMRELWYTGWMHNRVRMIVASFLTKNLRQHWHEGERWFWDTLVDADLASNTLGWQWVAGCGADAAPYFRVFNPVTQSKKFDPDGVYLKRWLPELADFPRDLLHEPWKDPERLRRSGYPSPIVDLAASREEALAAYQGAKDPG